MTSPNPLIFTDRAALKVFELIREENNLNLKLRVYVTGGGCSGFQYGFTFEEKSEPDDTIITKTIKFNPIFFNKNPIDNQDQDTESDEGEGSVQLLIDPLSLQYLLGAEIDYMEEDPATLQGEQFIIRNPNAKTTCGCGSSF